MSTVFILGAGFSAHAGIPLMNNFFDKAQDLYYLGELTESEKACLEDVNKARYKLSTIASKANVDINNLENVFELLEMAKYLERMPVEQKEESGWDITINNLKRIIVATIEKSVKYRHNNAERDNYWILKEAYMAFIRMIYRLKFQPKGQINHEVSVITLNYDMMIEAALTKLNTDEARIYGLGKIDRYYYGSVSLNGRIGNALELLKLHGSVNWFEQFNSIDVRYDYFLDHYFEIKQNGTIINNYSSITRNRNLINSPLIIPPTWNKVKESEQLQQIWQTASDRISQADNIVFIGYSLPDSDQVFKRFFSLSLMGDKVIKKIVLADPNAASLLPKFKSLLGKSALDRLYIMPHAFGANQSHLNVIGGIAGLDNYSHALYNFLTDREDKEGNMIRHYTEFEK
ncbi:hypothetical protein EP331_14560 [bacterium]|nr:MAG: hypothetical protein EP331_14560 [bacterium]